MAHEDLKKEALLRLSVGHVLALWDVLSDKLSGTPFIEALSEDEKRAIWALQDLCEQSLIENGISSLPEAEWNRLVADAKLHVREIPVDFLE